MSRFDVKMDILRRQNKRMIAVGSRLRRAQEDQKMSQSEIGDACGATKMMVSHWESGQHLMSDEHLENAAKKLKVDFEWLRTGKSKAR
jgi:transcriptional regulator with XRE-family HTH domain